MTRRRLTSIRLDKIAAVDKPCQEHAIVAIMKRAPGPDAPPAIAKRTFDEALRAQLVSEKVGDVFWRAFENQWAVREAFRTAMTDEIADGGDGTDAVAGFTAAMQQIATLAADAAREAASTAEPDLAAAVEQAIDKYLNETDEQETTMSKFTTKAALLGAIAKFDLSKSTAQDVADIKDSAVALNETGSLPAEGVLAIAPATGPSNDVVEKLRTEVTVLKMAPAIRKHYDGLDEAGQTAFIAKTDAERQADVDAIEKGDPIVHTCSDGTVIRKSDGAAVLAMAKRGDTLAAENADLRKGMAGASIEKRAAEYTNVAKGTAEEMLRTADAVGADTDAGKDILKSLETMNKGQSALFKRLGTAEGGTDGNGGDIAKSRTTFDNKVTEIAKRDSIGRSDAMTKARHEAPELFAEAYPDTVAAEEASQEAANATA